jgi:hypothetical protein
MVRISTTQDMGMGSCSDVGTLHGAERSRGEGGQMRKWLGRILRYWLTLTLDSRSHSARGMDEGVRTFTRGEESAAPECSVVIPCLNGCIGLSPSGGKAGIRPHQRNAALGQLHPVRETKAMRTS